jgi:hypothetical protein
MASYDAARNVCRALSRDALLGALRARLLLGPAPATAATAAAVLKDLARVGLAAAGAAAASAGPADGGFVGDVGRLAGLAMRGVGRVTWVVHGPLYEVAAHHLLAQEDEL